MFILPSIVQKRVKDIQELCRFLQTFKICFEEEANNSFNPEDYVINENYVINKSWGLCEDNVINHVIMNKIVIEV